MTSVLGIDPSYAKPIVCAWRVGRGWTLATLDPNAPANWQRVILSAHGVGIRHAVIEGLSDPPAPPRTAGTHPHRCSTPPDATPPHPWAPPSTPT